VLRATSAGSVLLALLTIWLPPRMPAQDAPLYHLAMRVISEPAVFDGYIDWGLPLSGGAVQLLGGTALSFLDPTVALKLLVSVGLAAYVAAALRLSRLLEVPAPAAVAVFSALYLGWIFAMGFFNYLLAAAISTWACAHWIDAQASRRRLVACAALLVAAGYVHAVSMALTCLSFGLAATIARGPGWVLRRSLPLLAPTAFTLWVLYASAQAERDASGVQIEWAVMSPMAMLTTLPRMVFAVYSELGVLLCVWVAALLPWAAWRALRERAERGPAGRLSGGFALAGLACLLLTLVTPLHVVDWHFVQPRLLILAFGAPAVAVVPRARLAQLATCTLALAVIAAGLLPAVREGERIDEAASMLPGPGQRVGLTFLQLAGERSPFFDVPLQRSGLHAHAYGMLGGGASHFTFPGTPRINPLRPSRVKLPEGKQFARLEDACARDPKCLEPQRRAHELAVWSLRYDTLLLPLAPQPLIEAVRALGWRWIAPYAFEVGRARLSLRWSGPPPAGPVIVRAGFPATLGVVRGVRLPPERLRDADGEAIEVGALPAGPLALEAFVDVNADGKAGPGDVALLPGGKLGGPMTLAPGEERELVLGVPGE
jgi:hypothetical protein